MNDEFEQNNDFEQGEDRLTELIKQAGETARRKKKKVLNKHFEKIRQAVKTAAS
ncbi:hypothetical protein [Candidatus Electrothrix sp.]|uniref:hypothetical protein n=1 Tax=Candidatus Electrothrix sp. TaxID=2170559 RepID=UPI004057A1B3